MMFDQICTAPWRHLFIGTNGDVKTCCIGRETLGNIHSDNIENIIAGNKLKLIQENILNNIIHKNCSECKKLYDTGIAGEKQNFTVSKWISEIESNPYEFIVKSLDIRWNNTCNLSCIYCNSEWSSNWNQLQNTKYSVKESENKEIFKLYINKNKQNIEKLLLLGGEPLLLKENVNLLENVHENAEIYIISNLSIPNLEENKIFKFLKNKKVSWGISFENIESKFEYVRNGASWKIFNENIQILKSYQNFSLNAQSVYNVFSAFDIKKFYDYCIVNQIPITWSNLIDPKQLDVRNLPNEYKEIALKNLEDLIEISFDDYKSNFKLLKNNLLNSKNFYTNLTGLKNFILKKELILKKQISFFDLWTEFN